MIDELGGAYITAEDIGTTTADMDLMSRFTRFCVGRSVEHGGRGDPSPVTAETVFARDAARPRRARPAPTSWTAAASA